MLNIIPDLIDLFLFGFIFVSILFWLLNIKQDVYLVCIYSLFANTIVKEFCSFAHDIFIPEYNISTSCKFIIYLTCAVIAPFVIYKLIQSKYVKNWLNKLSHKTISQDIFNDILDLKTGTYMMVWPKNSNYYYMGDFKIREENGQDSLIALHNYGVYKKESHDTIFDSNGSECNTILIFSLKDIEFFECFYDTDSDTWKFLSTNV